MKTCPYCAEQIQDDAIKCRYCGSMLDPGVPDPGAPATPTLPAGLSAGRPFAGSPTGPRLEDEALQFSHSGQRYLLGYGATFFGIWDRILPGAPVRRFPRSDEGWREAWLAYVAIEPHYAEVGIGGAVGGAAATGWSSTSSAWDTARPEPARPVSGAWWLLPILLGWLGGLIAWLVNKEADPRTARAMLLVGLAMSVLGALLVALTWPSINGG